MYVLYYIILYYIILYYIILYYIILYYIILYYIILYYIILYIIYNTYIYIYIYIYILYGLLNDVSPKSHYRETKSFCMLWNGPLMPLRTDHRKTREHGTTTAARHFVWRAESWVGWQGKLWRPCGLSSEIWSTFLRYQACKNTHGYFWSL